MSVPGVSTPSYPLPEGYYPPRAAVEDLGAYLTRGVLSTEYTIAHQFTTFLANHEAQLCTKYRGLSCNHVAALVMYTAECDAGYRKLNAKLAAREMLDEPYAAWLYYLVEAHGL
jgi:hypothetical protein